MFGFIIDTLVFLGLGHPMSRAIAFGCIGFAFQYFYKPGISYQAVGEDKTGKKKYIAKDFYLVPSNSKTEKTWFPWYFWPVFLSLFFALFV